jgi:hypothetical protein
MKLFLISFKRPCTMRCGTPKAPSYDQVGLPIRGRTKRAERAAIALNPPDQMGGLIIHLIDTVALAASCQQPGTYVILLEEDDLLALNGCTDAILPNDDALSHALTEVNGRLAELKPGILNGISVLSPVRLSIPKEDPLTAICFYQYGRETEGGIAFETVPLRQLQGCG